MEEQLKHYADKLAFEIDSWDLKVALERGEQVTVIDARSVDAYALEHIPGAINIPRGVLEFQVDAHPAVANVSDEALSHKERPIVVVCRTGGRAALAALSLQRLGFTDVCSIAGGVMAWGEAGLPLVVR